MNYEKIGEFIASRRKEKNLTQNELAKKVGVTDKAVSKWERGLGCPDVSILEMLANELDVSVLELLKGREIENEVIKVTEADDYLKESLNVSKKIIKNNLIDKISKIIFVTVVVISILFITLSINNYLVSKKGEHLYLGADFTSERDSQLNIMRSNIETLKANRGILTVDEQEMLVEGLESLVSYYENHYIYHLSDKKKYSTNDILKYFLADLEENAKFPFGIIPLVNIFRNHDIAKELVPLATLSALQCQEIVDRDFFDYYSYKHHEYVHLKVSNSLQEYMDFELVPEDLSDCIDEFNSANIRYLKMYNALTSELIKAGETNA